MMTWSRAGRGVPRLFQARDRRGLPAVVLELEPGDIIPGPSGVRARSVARDGRLVDDFSFNVQGRRLTHVRNARPHRPLHPHWP
jgi:hypothetical protein